jgi:beta-glucanase (GH16 family)
MLWQFYSIVPKWVFTPSVDFYFIINTAVGGNWPGPPSNQTQFPQYHLVDYVRYYKGSADSADVLNAIKSEL